MVNSRLVNVSLIVTTRLISVVYAQVAQAV